MKRKRKHIHKYGLYDKAYDYWPWALVIALYPALVIARTNLVYGGYHYENLREQTTIMENQIQDERVTIAELQAIRNIPTQGLVPSTKFIYAPRN